jgi:hypothetical protein
LHRLLALTDNLRPPSGLDVKEVGPPGYHRVDLQQTEPQEPSSTDRPASEATAPPGERLRDQVISWIVPEDNPAGAVYGLITIGALLAAESGLRDTYPETIGSTVIAVVLYWFAHSYADVLGLRLSREDFSRGELWRTFTQDWAIVKGASLPLLALLVAWATGADQATGVTAAVWVAVTSLIGFELAAGIRSRAKPLELVVEVCVGAGMGLAILTLRAILH